MLWQDFPGNLTRCFVGRLLLRLRPQKNSAVHTDGNALGELNIDRYWPKRYPDMAIHQRDFNHHYRQQRFLDAHRYYEHSSFRHCARLSDSKHDIYCSRHGPRRKQRAANGKGAGRPAGSAADHGVHRQPDFSQRWSNGHSYLGDVQRDLRFHLSIHLNQR